MRSTSLGKAALLVLLTATLTVPLLARASSAPAECKHHGDLDLIYCDENHNMVADAPKDPQGYNNPKILVFSYAPGESAIVYEKLFTPFTQHLAQCTGKKVIYYPVESHAAEIDAMRSGRLHVAGFSAGTTIFAVNNAGAVPFAVKGDAKKIEGYHLILVVRKNSPFQKIADLKGKRVAHTSPTSNSGHLAPMALFPAQGLTPGKDYTIVFSGKHDQSILGVKSGDYDAAAVADTVFHRMARRGQIAEDNFRILYSSPRFPSSAFAYAHDLDPEFRNKMLQCFFDFRFPPEMQTAFDGADRFIPITYLKDWELVRKVEATGPKAQSEVWAPRGK